MKKLISILLAIVMVLSLAVTAFAAGAGSITVNSVSPGTTYTIYRMMDLESYKTGAAYAYTINDAWKAFFTDPGEGAAYIKVEDGYVTWTAAEDENTKIEFAQKALAYAQAQTPSIAVETFTIPANYEGTSYTFTNLDLGWYLVDTNAGALCGLTTTDPDASVNAKNGKPTVDKQVQEDLGGLWGDSNTADIGQIVNFMTDIHVAAGAQNYVLHDKMSNGLTFIQNTEGRGVTEVKLIRSGEDEKPLKLDTDYTVNTECTDGCTFEVVFTETLVKSLKANDRIQVYYNAMLNRNAVIAAEGNANESWMEYGENHYTSHDKTTTYTYAIDIIKTDSSNKLLDGAEFLIYDAETNGNLIAVVLMDDGVTYRRARQDELEEQLNDSSKLVKIVVKDGKVRIVGLDNGTYYLDEVKAPDGYNKLGARQSFIIDGSNLDAVFNGDIYSTGSGVHVVNKTGNMLPETGAAGTALFLAFGTFVMLATGVLLVTKKRMSMIQD